MKTASQGIGFGSSPRMRGTRSNERPARCRGFRPDSDNAADALAILHWAIDQENQA